MEESTIDALAERVDELERRLRRWHRGGVAVALAGAAMLIAGGAQEGGGAKKPDGGGDAARAEVSKVVKAERFVLLDEAGKVRAELGRAPKNKAMGLAIFDSHGANRAWLGTEQDAEVPCLYLLGPDGVVARVVLNVKPDGTPDVRFGTDPPQPPPP
jgi:hypothetical protein